VNDRADGSASSSRPLGGARRFLARWISGAVRALIGPFVVLAAAALCGLFGMNVASSNLKWVSLDVPLNLTAKTSSYVFKEPDGGDHAVALKMNRYSGSLDTACVFQFRSSPKMFDDEDCHKVDRGSSPVKLTWELFERGKLLVYGHYASGDSVGTFLGETPPLYMLGADSDDAAHPFQDDAAHYSEMIPTSGGRFIDGVDLGGLSVGGQAF
jgi:hypothetical protein